MIFNLYFLNFKFVLIFLIVIQYKIVYSSNSLQILENQFVRVRQIKDLKQFPKIENADYQTVNENTWRLTGTQLNFLDIQLSKENYIIKKANQNFDIISLVLLEDYLSGVLVNEVSIKWPIEALKAQVVVAHSYAIAKIKEQKNNYYQLDSDVSDQVFKYTKSSKAKSIVKSTLNYLLKHKDGSILKAYYHADCGGQTIPASSVWSGAKDSGTATDPWCRTRESNKWSFQVKRIDLKLHSKHLNDLEVNRENIYFQKLALYKDKITKFFLGNNVFLSTQQLRENFGFSNIKNSPLRIEQESDQILFYGQGYGHGAGLCQWGSRAMALEGYNFKQILQHYYSSAELSEINPINQKDQIRLTLNR